MEDYIEQNTTNFQGVGSRTTLYYLVGQFLIDSSTPLYVSRTVNFQGVVSRTSIY